ncbi:hypothetical protein [Oceanicoccus sp. KOV_DT_Chl]|uniref:hypothetical protein n=1 Tax=Oceanicoccus sp. KOV_DT_Chl TaxID=1904639 RepID=UPI000C7A1D99|nr:hypothetical protein [Oceanicoccus sp. KOV_DT_Chl]
MAISSENTSPSIFNKLYQSSKQPLLYSLLLLAAVVLVASVSNYLSGDRNLDVTGADAVFLHRDFSRTPFALMDAYDACVYEAQSKLGNSLLRSEILPLSTRYNYDRNSYKVVLDVDVGTVHEWLDAHIYCDIDPEAQELSYYKEIYRGEPSLLAKTMSMLGDLIN